VVYPETKIKNEEETILKLNTINTGEDAFLIINGLKLKDQ